MSGTEANTTNSTNSTGGSAAAVAEEPKEVYLEADKELPGQHYVALSFLSPNSVLKNKDVYLFSEFMKDYEVQYKIKSTESFIMSQVATLQSALSRVQDQIVALTSRTDPLTVEDLSGASDILADTRKTLTADAVAALETHVKANMTDYKINTIQESFETFMYKNRRRLEDDFFATNSFRTTVQGLKVRGVYDTYNEAVHRAKTLQKLDPSFNVYVGQVGFWLPWDPEPHAVADQEYADEQLNTLMKKYRENEATRDELYAAEKVSRMGNAKVKGAPAKSTAQIGGAGPSTEDLPKSMFETEDLGIARRRERIEKKVDEVVEVAKNVVTHA
jgi:hypothetical protein